jgi:cyanophycinase-like exopeptidase
MRITENIILIVYLCISLASCSHTPEKSRLQNDETGNISRQVFLIGNGPNSKETVKDMIEKSEIKNGGYVVILHTFLNKNDSAAYYLRKEFYDRQIMAVHILELNNAEKIKNTDVLTVENARILCLFTGNMNKFVKMAEKTRLKNSLLKAYKNGTLIAGVGNGASVLGEYYYNRVMDTITHSVKIIMKKGLGLLKNTAIDDIPFFRNYEDGIQKILKIKILCF